jgi:hypothetical protein
VNNIGCSNVPAKGTETWVDLSFSADIDLCSFIILWHANFLIGSNLWIAQQTVEKYLKAIASKFSIRGSFEHNIVTLWNEIKNAKDRWQENDLPLASKYDNIISDVATITTSARYSSSSHTSAQGFFDIVLLTTYLRRHLVGKEEYSKNYGLNFLGWGCLPLERIPGATFLPAEEIILETLDLVIEEESTRRFGGAFTQRVGGVPAGLKLSTSKLGVSVPESEIK